MHTRIRATPPPPRPVGEASEPPCRAPDLAPTFFLGEDVAPTFIGLSGIAANLTHLLDQHADDRDLGPRLIGLLAGIDDLHETLLGRAGRGEGPGQEATPRGSSPDTWTLMEVRLAAAQVRDLLGTALARLERLAQDVDLPAGLGRSVTDAARSIGIASDGVEHLRRSESVTWSAPPRGA